MTSATTVRGLLLAAGQAARFGSDKRLARLPGGFTLLEHSVGAWLQALDEVHVALRPDDTALITRLRALGARPCIVPGCVDGLGTSLAQAAAQLPAGPLLVGLADMPFIAPATIRALAARLEAGADLVAPFHSGRRGQPVGFSDARRSLLTGLSGDRGAGELLKALPLERLEVEDAGVLLDIDRPQDLPAGRVL